MELLTQLVIAFAVALALTFAIGIVFWMDIRPPTKQTPREAEGARRSTPPVERGSVRRGTSNASTYSETLKESRCAPLSIGA
jgi:hypothetical protein